MEHNISEIIRGIIFLFVFIIIWLDLDGDLNKRMKK
jgi:hypothetical protein